jgi:hypothetical protein
LCSNIPAEEELHRRHDGPTKTTKEWIWLAHSKQCGRWRSRLEHKFASSLLHKFVSKARAQERTAPHRSAAQRSVARPLLRVEEGPASWSWRQACAIQPQ